MSSFTWSREYAVLLIFFLLCETKLLVQKLRLFFFVSNENEKFHLKSLILLVRSRFRVFCFCFFFTIECDKHATLNWHARKILLLFCHQWFLNCRFFTYLRASARSYYGKWLSFRWKINVCISLNYTLTKNFFPLKPEWQFRRHIYGLRKKYDKYKCHSFFELY